MTPTSPDPTEGTERHRDLDRLLTFVDAAIAIAMTLLVLPLVELTTDAEGLDDTGALVREHQAELWSFLLSFAVIWQFWFAQHDALRPVVRPLPALNRLLMLWTLTIVFLPFPTALIARTDVDDPVTKLLYIGTLLLSSLWIAMINVLVRRSPQITDGSPAPDAAPGIVTVILLGAALVIALAFPATSYFPLLLLFLTGPALRIFRRNALPSGDG